VPSGIDHQAHCPHWDLDVKLSQPFDEDADMQAHADRAGFEATYISWLSDHGFVDKL
jgi:hypothetical protein